VGYEYPLSADQQDNKTPAMLYGLMDEESRININTAPEETLSNLLIYFDIDEDNATEIAGAILDWRDKDDLVTSSEDRASLWRGRRILPVPFKAIWL